MGWFCPHPVGYACQQWPLIPGPARTAYSDGRWKLGRYRGVPMEDVPTIYLVWAIEHLSQQDAIRAACDELQRRRDYA
jgi:DNA-binding transcriptional LysR family regulator